MKRPSKLRLAVLTLALAGFCLTPAAGKADYYPWGSYYWPSYTSYYPGYSAGYFPSYWDGYYSGVYTTGYYPSWSSYYAPSCCGSCGWSGCGSCSYGCGSCGVDAAPAVADAVPAAWAVELVASDVAAVRVARDSPAAAAAEAQRDPIAAAAHLAGRANLRHHRLMQATTSSLAHRQPTTSLPLAISEKPPQKRRPAAPAVAQASMRPATIRRPQASTRATRARTTRKLAPLPPEVTNSLLPYPQPSRPQADRPPSNHHSAPISRPARLRNSRLRKRHLCRTYRERRVMTKVGPVRWLREIVRRTSSRTIPPSPCRSSRLGAIRVPSRKLSVQRRLGWPRSGVPCRGE